MDRSGAWSFRAAWSFYRLTRGPRWDLTNPNLSAAHRPLHSPFGPGGVAPTPCERVVEVMSGAVWWGQRLGRAVIACKRSAANHGSCRPEVSRAPLWARPRRCRPFATLGPSRGGDATVQPRHRPGGAAHPQLHSSAPLIGHPTKYRGRTPTGRASSIHGLSFDDVPGSNHSRLVASGWECWAPWAPGLQRLDVRPGRTDRDLGGSDARGAELRRVFGRRVRRGRHHGVTDLDLLGRLDDECGLARCVGRDGLRGDEGSSFP